MVVLIDTNVIIDFLATREPFYQAASVTDFSESTVPAIEPEELLKRIT